jgi:hypothetical protein
MRRAKDATITMLTTIMARIAATTKITPKVRYPDAPIKETHLSSVRRALRKLPELWKGRSGNYGRKGGWHYAIQWA